MKVPMQGNTFCGRKWSGFMDSYANEEATLDGDENVAKFSFLGNVCL